MAVKERKQITGTTAQINAYEGHEGQVVWDKEKKTLVGMSGTAGKNYPLAPKTYVDNEISKVNTEVAKKQPKGDYATNTQLTEGLAGKEDKGTCFPLTGGILRGDLLNDPDIRQELYMGHDYNARKGALIALRSANTEDPNRRGTFAIACRTPEQEAWLIGEPAGDLWWGPRRVVSTDSGGNGWVRFDFGIQICWGGIGILANNINTTVNLPVPFANQNYNTFTEYTDPKNLATVSTASGEKTASSFRVGAANPNYSWDRWVEWIAIGYWK